ncbi:hypothetical protein [Parageobacillus thermoglucosidasius]|uniref:hypothetical protein n=1 Tax=Parageobacillus thermoglucosidasius TaxID=1426 RepID=UPI00025B7344|nr:hypothetical protein [Parageobacillus thermoglucosidasius]KYD12948.1 hypothetical protein B4168_2832 [Anoxybacillus flavithermus]REK57612.1 MAG: hypothetical protein C6P36_05940 [Geobacillus sp.]EID43751.1 putative membrane protein [Parageobacillus thermoglucosidasius TNO-09.020]OAO84889.1 hypothetical protein GT23_3275 [Parageobacillus thermoglucosidasius]GMO01076.1 hypothetical protein PthstB1num2_31160 [Parageobacillus thermoglucosidasius]
MQKKVERKLFHLFIGELSAAVIFALIWIMYIQLFEWAEPYLTSFSSLYAFILLEFILLQGSFYWFLKWKQVQRKCYSHLPYHQLRLFAFFKRFNLLLISIGLLFMIYQFKVFPIDFYWFVFLYVFAIIEHINYYHIRLSYQSIEEIKDFIRQKGFRSSKLARELKNL